jgi:carbamoyltransferase
MANVLGVHATFSSHLHDPSVALVREGRLVFAIEEERLNRFKTSPGIFPELAIKAAHKSEGISVRELDAIAIDGTTSKELPFKVERHVRQLYGYCPPILRIAHPIAHGSGAFYASPFDEALVISVDGEGDGISVLVYIDRRQGKRQLLYKSLYPNSLGAFYTVFTNYLGFKSIEGEFKVMGMSAYGDPDSYDLSEILSFDSSNGKVAFDSRIRDARSHTSVFETHANYDIIELLTGVPPVYASSPNRTQVHFDLAASVQRAFQDTFVSLIDYYVEKSCITNIALSGGCALNCLANMTLLCNRDYSIYIQPAASDRGLSIGSAFEASRILGDTPLPASNMYLGPSYDRKVILNAIRISGLDFTCLANPSEHAARSIMNGYVIGWFQGRSEFGPRALGARSILASPSICGNKDKLNAKIKFREMFRPFAPAVLSDDMKRLTGFDMESPYMTSTFPVLRSAVTLISECCHEDLTARIQTVSEHDDPLFHLLRSLKELTGIGACINTSFNLAGEPIVENPTDALRTFISSGIDLLYMDNYLVQKR